MRGRRQLMRGRRQLLLLLVANAREAAADPRGSSTPESSMEMALPRQNLIPRQNFNPTPKPPTPQHTTKISHLHAKVPRQTLPWGRNARISSLVPSLIFPSLLDGLHKSSAPRQKKRPRMETTPESRPPRQNIRLHARIDHFHARINAPTPEF